MSPLRIVLAGLLALSVLVGLLGGGWGFFLLLLVVYTGGYGALTASRNGRRWFAARFEPPPVDASDPEPDGGIAANRTSGVDDAAPPAVEDAPESNAVIDARNLDGITTDGHGRMATVEVVLHRLEYLSPTNLKIVVSSLLRVRGFTNVLMGGADDFGVDIHATDAAGRRVGIECRGDSIDSPIRSRDVEWFVERAFSDDQLDRGIFVTASSFTTGAVRVAHRHQIELVDRVTLARVLLAADSQDEPHLRSGAESHSAADRRFLRSLGIEGDDGEWPRMS